MDKIVAVNIAAWLACLVFVVTGANAIIKFWRNIRGNDPQPPNTQLGQSVLELNRRVSDLEDWRVDLTAKLESDKIEILNAGEERASRIHSHIEADRVETARKLDELRGRVEKQSQDTERALGRIEGTLEALKPV